VRKSKAMMVSALIALALGSALLLPAPAAAQKKEIIQLQRDMDLLAQSFRELQRTVDEKHAVLKTLVEQSLDAINRLSLTLGALQKTVQDVQANTGARMDTLATQVQALADNLEEAKVRLGRVSQQVAESQGVLQSLDAKLSAPATGSGEPAETPAGGNPPAPAETLYTSAWRDYMSGKYELARKGFLDYLRFYPDSEYASNAQFYLGEILFTEKKYADAISQYDKVLDNYPKSYKLADARFKKAMALLELGQRAAAVREFREVVRRHPGTDMARRAQAKLRELGAVASN